MQHESDRNDTSATRVRHEQHECNTIVKRVLHERYECDTNATRTTRVRNFNFDNDTSENIFSYPYISYTANKRLQGEEQLHSKNYLLEMPLSHAKMHLKSAPQNVNFVMAKAISKSYTLDCSCKCSCTFPHSYT